MGAFSWPPRADESRGCEIVDSESRQPVDTNDAPQDAGREPVFFDPAPPPEPEPPAPVEFVAVDPKESGDGGPGSAERDPAAAFGRVLGSTPSPSEPVRPRDERGRASLAVFAGLLCASLTYLDYRSLDQPLLPGSDDPLVASLPEPAPAPFPQFDLVPGEEVAAERLPAVTAPRDVPPRGEVTHAALRVVTPAPALAPPVESAMDAGALRPAAVDVDVRPAVVQGRQLAMPEPPQVITGAHAAVDALDGLAAPTASTDYARSAGSVSGVRAEASADVRDSAGDATAAPAGDLAPPSAGPEATSSRSSAPAPALTEEERIRSTLTQFRTAYAQLSAPSARRVWPTVDVAALSRAFRSLRSQDLTFERCDLDVHGQEASAACRGSATYVPRIGSQKPRTDEREWNFTLKKIEDRWTIETANVR